MRGKRLALALAAAAVLGAPRGAEAGCLLQKYADIPVTMVGLRPTVAVKINGADARLDLDTGSFFSVLTPEAAARLGLRKEPLPSNLRVLGVTGAADMGVTNAKTFQVFGYTLHGVDFLVAEHGLGEDGILGQNVIGGADAEYDLANGVVRLFKPKGCESAVLAYWARGGPYGEMSIQPIAPPSNSIIGSAKVNGARISVELDTGAARSMLTLGAARRAGVSTSGPEVVPAGPMIGLGRRLIQTWLAPFSSFDIGGEQIKGTKLRLADLELSGADMVLGVDFFLSHRIYISRSQDKVYFTYNGGPVFNLEQTAGPAPAVSPAVQAAAPAAPSLGTDEPTDGTGYARRAAAFVSRKEYAQAIADDTRAIALEPAVASHYYDRAVARALSHQPVLAMSDLDEALKRKPNDWQALMVRGELKLAGKDGAGATADFQAALAHDPALRLRVADAYVRAADFADAVQNFDAWIDGRPRNEDLATGLAGRCWARALWRKDLDRALADCNEALELYPGLPQALESRGLVHLRLDQPDRAISDFTAGLKLEPRNAWSLLGRGIAELDAGQQDKGAADVAAARAIAPGLPDFARKLGIEPPAPAAAAASAPAPPHGGG